MSDLALEGILIHDGQRIQDANCAAPRMFGYDRDEFLTLPPAAFGGCTKPSNDSDHPWPAQLRLKKKDGSQLLVECRSRPIEDPAGPLWVTVIRDLSERELRDQALKDSEERVRLAQEAADIGHFDWDLTSGKTTWSESLKRFMRGGLGPDMSLLDRLPYVHPEDWARYEAAIKDAIAGRTDRVSLSYRCLAGDQAVCWRICEARVHHDETGKPARVVGVISDVTPHKRAETAQRDSVEKRRLESVLQSLIDAVVLFDQDARVLSMNPAALSLFEVESPAEAPQTIAQFAALIETTRLDGAPFIEEEWPVIQALQGRSPAPIEAQVRNRRTGRTWIASSGAAPVLEEDGSLGMAVVILRDITAERNATEQIRRTNTVLHELSGQLLRLQDEEHKRIARELHDGSLQGITAIAMNLLLITRSPALLGDPETRRVIIETQELAKKLSRELRTMSYLLHPPDLDELGLLPAVRSWADGFSQRTGIVVDVQLEDPGRLEPDLETALFRMAQEALANVHRHSGSATAEVRLSVSGDSLLFEVRDEGVGIPPEVLQRSSGRMGVGILGMRERARQLGGKLEVISNGDKGTIVRATLPHTVSQ